MKILKKIRSYYYSYQKNGIDGLLYALIKKLNINSKFTSNVDKRKYLVEKKIIKLTQKTVVNGPYKSLKLNCNTHWAGFDFSSKLIGMYERQVQDKIINLREKFNLENMINFGCGDGYHLIGSIKNNDFKLGLAFEIDERGLEYMKDNIKLNDLGEKIKVFKKANFEDVNKLLNKDQLKKTIYLVDIEGEEFDLFNQKNLTYFKDSILLIENHHFLRDKNIVKNFFEFMKNYFDLEIIKNGPRNPHELPLLDTFDDDEKWLIMSEGRKQSMEWLVFIPKQI